VCLISGGPAFFILLNRDMEASMGKSLRFFLLLVGLLGVFTQTSQNTLWADSSVNLKVPGLETLRMETVEGRRVKVSSICWRLEFDLLNGGILDTIVFPNGSGKNLLVAPLQTSVGSWSDSLAPRTDFRSSKEGEILRLEFSGQMGTAGRQPGPIEFVNEWTLTPLTVRIDHRLRLTKDLEVSTIGIGSFAVRSDLDEFGLRVGVIDDPDPRKQSPARFGKADRAGQWLIREHHAPLYMLLFHRGLEGLDLSMASDLEAWEKGLTGADGLGNYSVKLSDDGSEIHVIRQALDSAQPVNVRKGEYTFSYYLGLPRLMEKANRQWRHLSFGNHPWPSEGDIKKWAESGVNIARLHNDYTEDENFWHDAAWPPYDEKGMNELRRVIATCHRFKIKVVPYFSVHEFHPKAQGYQDHEQSWKRSTDQMGTVYHNLWGKGEFGAQMCPQSGWLERRKQDVEKAYRELGFDGIYYDWVWGLPCNNRNHNPRLHLGNDGILDFLAWTRRLISSDGTLILHLYGQFPSITLENYADLVVNMEENSDSEAMMKIAEIPLVTVLAESIPRSPCPSYRLDQALERNRNNIAQLVVLGMFPWADGAQGPVLEETLKLFRNFRPYALENYRLFDAFSGGVRTAWPDVYGAIYRSDQQTIVVLSNTSSQRRKNISWTMNPSTLGYPASTKQILLRNRSTGEEQLLDVSVLTDGSLQTELSGFEYQLYELKPVP
jgi:hypothetical protein